LNEILKEKDDDLQVARQKEQRLSVQLKEQKEW
jgi:hypothetical protein